MDKLDIFVPVENKNLTHSYPELATIPAFENLRSLDAKFAWYYAIYFSEEKEKRKRIQLAIDNSYKQTIKPEELAQYIMGDFPEKIREAILWFQKMDAPARVTAKFTCERILDSYMKLVDVNIDDVGRVKVYDDKTNKELGENRDWNQVNSFVNATTKINESLPELIKTIEHGFGISKRVKRMKGITENLRDDYLESKEDNATKN